MGGSFSFQNLPCSRSMCSTLQRLYKVGKGYCIITNFLVVLFLGFEPIIQLPMDLFLILLVTMLLKQLYLVSSSIRFYQ